MGGWVSNGDWGNFAIQGVENLGGAETPLGTMHIVKNQQKFSQTAKKLSSGFGLHAFFKNVLYKNVEAEICRKFKNVQGS